GYGEAHSALLWLRSLQDRIGDWHDVEALEDEIIDVVAQKQFLKEHVADAGMLLGAAGHLRKRKTQLIRKLFPVRVPKTLIAAGSRLSRSLRRSASRPRTQSSTRAGSRAKSSEKTSIAETSANDTEA